jgi:hypothetical protein
MSLHMLHRVVLAMALVLLVVTAAEAAEPVGRYQAIALTKPNDTFASALIIDTETGELWTWEGGSGGLGGR